VILGDFLLVILKGLMIDLYESGLVIVGESLELDFRGVLASKIYAEKHFGSFQFS
jgi:hypothetical protein